MKRPLILLAAAALVLAAVLALQLRRQRLALEGPVGGSGTIEGVEIDVTPRIAARILAIHVREGDPVAAGDLLVELDCAEMTALQAEAGARLAAAEDQERGARAQADAAQAQTEVLSAQEKAAGRELARLTELKGAGAVTVRDLDRAATAVADLDHRLDAARAQLAAARDLTAAAGNQAAAARAAGDRAAIGVAECRLVAPRAGIVQTRAYEPGEVVLPGSRILLLVDASTARITFYIPNAELAAAAPGKPVTVVADAYPGRTFAGTIVSVAQEAEFTPRNVQTRADRDRLVYAVEVRLPNPDGQLRPGMPVEVTIDGSGRRS